MGGRPSPRRRRQGLRHRNGSARAGHRAARTSAPAGPVPAAGARTASGSTGDSPRTAHHARGTGPAKAPAHARIPAVAGDTPRPLASTASSPARSPWGTGRVSRRARKPARSTLGHAPPCHGDHGLPPRSRGRAHPLQTGRTRPDVRPPKTLSAPIAAPTKSSPAAELSVHGEFPRLLRSTPMLKTDDHASANAELHSRIQETQACGTQSDEPHTFPMKFCSRAARITHPSPPGTAA